MTDEQRLFALKEKIDEAKNTVAELTGQLQAHMKQLNDDWSCTTVKDAEVKLRKIDADIESLEAKITKGVKSLEKTIEIKGIE